MDEISTLRNKGYDVNTRDQGIGWLCSLELDNRIQTFRGATEREALQRAVTYVGELEERFRLQQERLGCEGCGEYLS